MSAKTSKVQLFESMLSAWKESFCLPQWKRGTSTIISLLWLHTM